MSLFIEYYEVYNKASDSYEYYFMPMDKDAINKHNFDSASTRIWKVNKKTNRVAVIKDRRKDNPPAMAADELFAILFTGKQVPYSEYYMRLQQIRAIIENGKETDT